MFPVFLGTSDLRIRNFCTQLSGCLDELLQKKLQVNFGSDCIALKTCDVIRILSAFEVDDAAMLPLKNLLLKMTVQAQGEAGGSAFLALQVCIETIAIINKLQQSNVNLSYLKEYSIEPILSQISNYSRSVTEEDAKKILHELIDDDLTYALVHTAAKLAGPNGQIFIDEKCQTSTHVELKRGYNFECSVVPTFAIATRMQTWEYSQVKCIVIDGIIESVSEIHHMLEALNKMQAPAALFARGFSEEVLATLSTNTLRGTLNVIPIMVGYTVIHANTLKDIAVACGTDVTSSLKGELISSIAMEDIPAIDKLKVTLNHVIISHPKSENIVKVHMKNLKKQKEDLECSEQDIPIKSEKIELLNERIKALSTNCANIALGPDLKTKKDLIHDRIKNAIMILRETTRFGKISVAHIQLAIDADERCCPINSAISKTIAKIKKTTTVMPAAAVLVGIKRGTECALAISSVGAILLRH